jgi:hypothetical protein
MVHPTLRTFPLSNIQRHLVYDMPTIPTPFRARKPAIDLNQFSSIPLAFVGELADRFAPTSITNGKGKFMILDHVLDRQVLNHYRLVVSLCKKSLRASVICAWILATFAFALCRLLLPFCLRDSAFCTRLNFLRSCLKCLGLVILSPLLVAIRLVIPTSKPIALSVLGSGLTVWSSTSKDTNQRL